MNDAVAGGGRLATITSDPAAKPGIAVGSVIGDPWFRRPGRVGDGQAGPAGISGPT